MKALNIKLTMLQLVVISHISISSKMRLYFIQGVREQNIIFAEIIAINYTCLYIFFIYLAMQWLIM